eukprot:10105164-Lingulodinium_polyedra.AAC.1
MARRISALSFASFALAVADALRKSVAPLALKAQLADVGAGEMDAACRDALAEIRSETHSLSQLR